MRPCAQPGCPELVREGRYCAKHQPQEVEQRADAARQYDTARRDRQSAEFYHSKAWRAARQQVLMRDHGLCQDCLADGRLRPADTVHHIIGLKEDWTKRLQLDNLSSLCAPCHNRIHGDRRDGGLYYPESLRPSAALLTIVCGPPGSGKTTYVHEHAAVGDIVIDLDAITSELSGMPWYQAGDSWLYPALAERNRRLQQLANETGRRAWFIVTAARPGVRQWWRKKLQPKQVVVIETPLAVCVQRLQRDERRQDKWQRYQAVAAKWWIDYQPAPGEVRVRG